VPEAPALRAVLFDAAGTLVLLREPVGETYARVFRGFGADVPPARLEDAFRRIFAKAPPLVFPDARPEEVTERERDWWREVVRQTLRAADATARLRDADAGFEALWAHYAGAAAWRAAEGAEACLRALRERGLRAAVVSNFDGRLAGILAELGLLPLLDAVVRPADAGFAKPDARIFGFALRRLGVSAAQAAYVGDDRDQDVRAARGAGLVAVDVASLATLRELPERLDELPEEST